MAIAACGSVSTFVAHDARARINTNAVLLDLVPLCGAGDLRACDEISAAILEQIEIDRGIADAAP